MRGAIKSSLLVAAAVAFGLIQAGCEPETKTESGFLSDYTRLQKSNESSMQFINTRELSRFSRFIVDPVEMNFSPDSSASQLQEKGVLSEETVSDLANYMHDSIVKAVETSGNKVVYRPAIDVARIRAAITDLDVTKMTSLLPSAKVIGAGVGGASLEAEIIDSMTKQQIGAIVESRRGSTIPFDGMGNWDAAKQAMDQWAQRFQKRLEDAK